MMACGCARTEGYAEVWHIAMGELLTMSEGGVRIVSATFIDDDRKVAFLSGSGELVLVESSSGRVCCRYQVRIANPSVVAGLGGEQKMVYVTSEDRSEAEVIVVRGIEPHAGCDDGLVFHSVARLGSPAPSGDNIDNEITDAVREAGYIIVHDPQIVRIARDAGEAVRYSIEGDKVVRGKVVQLRWHTDLAAPGSSEDERIVLPPWKQFESIRCAGVSRDGAAIAVCGQYGNHWAWHGISMFAMNTGLEFLSVVPYQEAAKDWMVVERGVADVEEIAFVGRERESIVCLDDYGGIHRLGLFRGVTNIRPSCDGYSVYSINRGEKVGIAMVSPGGRDRRGSTASEEQSDEERFVLEVFSIGSGHIRVWRRTLPRWAEVATVLYEPVTCDLSDSHNSVAIGKGERIIVYDRRGDLAGQEWSVPRGGTMTMKMSSDGRTIVGWRGRLGEDKSFMSSPGEIWCWSRARE
jgi:hypothetical protein